MAERTTHVINGLPSDLLSSFLDGVRKLKVSSTDSVLEAAINECAFTMAGIKDIPAGESIGLNISLAADSIIYSFVVSGGLPFALYSEHATGNADGIVLSEDLNFKSIDVSPTQAQIYEDAVPAGGLVYSSEGSGSINAVAGFGDFPSIMIDNDTGGSVSARFTIVYEELGARNPVFGLTPSTQLEPSTEMSTYG